MTMPAPVADERAGLREFLTTQQRAFEVVAVNLSDQQASCTPSASALSLAGLIKHLTHVQRMWNARVSAAPELTATDQRPVDEQAAEFGGNFIVGEQETLAGLLAAFSDSSAEAVRLLESADLDTVVPVPPGVPWFPQDGTSWTVRYVYFKLIEELTRHAGHADIIRESIDGATLYELISAHSALKEN
jgi:hypothetical protein